MTKTLASTFVCATILACAGVAHAQSTSAGTAMSSEPAASSGRHLMKKRHSGSKYSQAEMSTAPTAQPSNDTPGIRTQSGSVVPTTPDPMQIKNARDGTPMKTAKGGMGMASGAGK